MAKTMAGSPSNSSTQVPLGEDLRRAVGAFVRAIREDAETPRSAQSEALAILEKDDAMNIARLADRRAVRHQTMRLIINQLEEAGLVIRHADPADGRSQLISLSSEGREALAQERSRRASQIDARIAANLSLAEQHILRSSITLLDRLSNGVAG